MGVILAKWRSWGVFLGGCAGKCIAAVGEGSKKG